MVDVPVGILTAGDGVMGGLVLGPESEPVQNVVPARLALCKTSVLSEPVE